MNPLRQFQDALLVRNVVARMKFAESLEVGKWYIQSFSDRELYFKATGEQKNGGWSGVLVAVDLTSRGKPKAKKDSVPKGFARLWKATSNVPGNVEEAAKSKGG